MYFFNQLDLLIDQEKQFEDVKWTFYMIINHKRFAKKDHGTVAEGNNHYLRYD